MKILSFLTLGAFTSLATVVAQDSCPVNSISCVTTNADSCCVPSYGIIVLTQQWVKGFGPKDAFTLHGLWPDTCSGGQGPANGCDTTRAYTGIENILKSSNTTLYNQMNTYWPSYNGDNGVFWEHEWGKHGTCVSTLNPKCYGSSYEKYEEMSDYFQTVLNLRAKYDLYRALSAAGIKPGSTYKRTAMASAIEQALGVTPYFKCTSGTISEIWTYYHVKGKDTYVPDSFNGTHSCGSTINYPLK